MNYPYHQQHQQPGAGDQYAPNPHQHQYTTNPTTFLDAQQQRQGTSHGGMFTSTNSHNNSYESNANRGVHAFVQSDPSPHSHYHHSAPQQNNNGYFHHQQQHQNPLLPTTTHINNNNNNNGQISTQYSGGGSLNGPHQQMLDYFSSNNPSNNGSYMIAPLQSSHYHHIGAGDENGVGRGGRGNGRRGQNDTRGGGGGQRVRKQHHENYDGAPFPQHSNNNTRTVSNASTPAPASSDTNNGGAGGPGTTFANLFVNRLPDGVTHEDLLDIFAEFKPKSATVMTDPKSGRSKGFGFIQFNLESDGKAAHSALHLRAVTARKINFTIRAFPSKHDANSSVEVSPVLYVRNVPKHIPKPDVERMLESFGSVIFCAMREEPDGLPVWVVLVEYDCQQCADNALSHLRINTTLYPNYRAVIAKYAKPMERKRHDPKPNAVPCPFKKTNSNDNSVYVNGDCAPQGQKAQGEGDEQQETTPRHKVDVANDTTIADLKKASPNPNPKQQPTGFIVTSSQSEGVGGAQPNPTNHSSLVRGENASAPHNTLKKANKRGEIDLSRQQQQQQHFVQYSNQNHPSSRLNNASPQGNFLSYSAHGLSVAAHDNSSINHLVAGTSSTVGTNNQPAAAASPSVLNFFTAQQREQFNTNNNSNNAAMYQYHHNNNANTHNNPHHQQQQQQINHYAGHSSAVPQSVSLGLGNVCNNSNNNNYLSPNGVLYHVQPQPQPQPQPVSPLVMGVSSSSSHGFGTGLGAFGVSGGPATSVVSAVPPNYGGGIAMTNANSSSQHQHAMVMLPPMTSPSIAALGNSINSTNGPFSASMTLPAADASGSRSGGEEGQTQTKPLQEPSRNSNSSPNNTAAYRNGTNNNSQNETSMQGQQQAHLHGGKDNNPTAGSPHSHSHSRSYSHSSSLVLQHANPLPAAADAPSAATSAQSAAVIQPTNNNGATSANFPPQRATTHLHVPSSAHLNNNTMSAPTGVSAVATAPLPTITTDKTSGIENDEGVNAIVVDGDRHLSLALPGFSNEGDDDDSSPLNTLRIGKRISLGGGAHVSSGSTAAGGGNTGRHANQGASGVDGAGGGRGRSDSAASSGRVSEASRVALGGGGGLDSSGYSLYSANHFIGQAQHPSPYCTITSYPQQQQPLANHNFLLQQQQQQQLPYGFSSSSPQSHSYAGPVANTTLSASGINFGATLGGASLLNNYSTVLSATGVVGSGYTMTSPYGASNVALAGSGYPLHRQQFNNDALVPTLRHDQQDALPPFISAVPTAPLRDSRSGVVAQNNNNNNTISGNSIFADGHNASLTIKTLGAVDMESSHNATVGHSASALLTSLSPPLSFAHAQFAHYQQQTANAVPPQAAGAQMIGGAANHQLPSAHDSAHAPPRGGFAASMSRSNSRTSSFSFSSPVPAHVLASMPTCASANNNNTNNNNINNTFGNNNVAVFSNNVGNFAHMTQYAHETMLGRPTNVSTAVGGQQYQQQQHPHPQFAQASGVAASAPIRHVVPVNAGNTIHTFSSYPLAAQPTDPSCPQSLGHALGLHNTMDTALGTNTSMNAFGPIAPLSRSGGTASMSSSANMRANPLVPEHTMDTNYNGVQPPHGLLAGGTQSNSGSRSNMGIVPPPVAATHFSNNHIEHNTNNNYQSVMNSAEADRTAPEDFHVSAPANNTNATETVTTPLLPFFPPTGFT